MPETRLNCPSCKAVVKSATALPVGKSIKCPKCAGVIKVRAVDLDDDERDEIDEDEPRRRKWNKDQNDRSEKEGGRPLGLWLGIGGGVLAVVIVVLAIVLSKKGAGKSVDKPGDPAPEAKEGGGSEAHTVARRIETNIPLPQRNPFMFARGILSLGASADAGVIAVTSGASPRQYTINRATGKFISEFGDPDTKPDLHGENQDHAYAWQGPLVSPNGKLVIVRLFHRHNSIKIRDIASGNVVKTLGGDPITHFGPVAFSLNGENLYALVHESGHNVLLGWNAVNWQQVCHIKIPENREPQSLFPLADGKTVVTMTQASEPRKAQADFFDVREQKFVRAFLLASWKRTGSTTVSPDGKLLAVVGDNGPLNRALEIYNMDTFKHISTVVESRDVSQPGGPLHDSFPQVGQLRFLSAGKLAMVADNSVAIHDPNTGAQKAVWKHSGEIGGRKITHLSLCVNGEILLVLDGETATILVIRMKE